MYFVEVRPPGANHGTQAAAPFEAPIAAIPLWSPRARAPASSRWSLDAWTLARAGSVHGGSAPQLGGAQAGVRIGYFLDEGHRAAAFARATTPLHRPGVELAAGLQWQPTRAPAAIFVEARRRVGGEIVPVVGVVGGIYRAPIASRWRLDGYGQAGMIGGQHSERFADGQIRVAREIGALGSAAIDAGVGAWGGVQRGASWFDLGPTIGVALPVAGRQFPAVARLAAAGRGQAAPASGPALTLGRRLLARRPASG